MAKLIGIGSGIAIPLQSERERSAVIVMGQPDAASTAAIASPEAKLYGQVMTMELTVVYQASWFAAPVSRSTLSERSRRGAFAHLDDIDVNLRHDR